MAKRHWVVLALALSMGINLMVAGVFIARWGFADRHRPPPLIWALQDLTPETREQLSALLRESFRETQPLRRELRASSERLRQLIAAEPLDVQALTGALADLRGTSARYQERVHADALTILPQLAPEERIAVAGRLLRPERERPRPGARSPGNRPPPDHLERGHRPKDGPRGEPRPGERPSI